MREHDSCGRQRQSRFKTLIAACGMAIATVTLPTGAYANTLTLADFNGPSDQVICTPSCEGFVGTNPGLISLSSTNADDYLQAGPPAGELARLNELLAQFDPPRPAVSFVNKNGGDASSYSTSRQYFSLKKANNLWFFENTSGGQVTIDGLGDNWSHATEYGAIVPEPTAMSLLMMMSLVLACFRRR